MKPTTGSFFEYDWPIDGKAARFAAETSYAQKKEICEEYPYLFFISCSSSKKDNSSLTLKERFFTRLFVNQLKIMMEPIFVGSIKNKNESQYFFYAKTDSFLEDIKNEAKKKKTINCRVDCIYEPSWDTYFSVLYPDEAKRQTEKNRETLELLEKNGFPMAGNRKICLHMFFKSEPKMLTFSERARLDGFAIGETEFVPEQEISHGVVLIQLSALRKKEIDDITTRAINLAKEYGGILSYWDCRN